MSYTEDLKRFTASHTYETITVGGGNFRYVLSGKKDGKTLVMLNGGMNVLEMWMEYVEPLSADYQVLLFDYPKELRTNQELVKGMHAFFNKLGITKPIFVGASDGGMVAQIYTQKYHKEVGGLILVSTGGMDAATLKSLKKKYFLAPLMLFYMKHCNYEKLKPKLIKVGMGHIRNESEEQVAYVRDMFETIFRDYTREKDVHISGLLADLMNQTPVTEKVDEEHYSVARTSVVVAQDGLNSNAPFIPERFYEEYEEIRRLCGLQLLEFEDRWNVGDLAHQKEKETLSREAYNRTGEINEKFKKLNNEIREYLKTLDVLE